MLQGRWTLVAPEMLGASPTEPHVLAWIEEFLRLGDTFFDVGAHYGWMSLVGCRCVGVKGRVVAFEPAAALVQCLEYNKRLNRLGQMEIVVKAVADEDGRTVPLYVVNRGESFLNSLVDHAMESADESGTARKSSVKVETVTLDGFCAARGLRPDLVKIDVEGTELLALRGARRLLEDGRAKFIVAMHPTWLPQGQTAEEAFEIFRAAGYRTVRSQVTRYEGADFGDYLFVREKA
jgi:FkbM family methyltransferase